MPLLAQPKAGRSFCYLGRPSDGSGTAIRCITGEMAEWLKARAWKVRLPERVTGVRIPLSPPLQSERRSRSADCDGSEPSLLGRADSAISRRPAGPTLWNEAFLNGKGRPKEGQSLILNAASRACSGERTTRMILGPKGRQSAMKPSPMGKADEGGQSLILNAASRACSGERTTRMIQGPQGRRSAMKPSPTGKADRREANPVNAIVPFTPHRRSAANCHL